MIASFKNKDLEKFYCEGKKAKSIPAEIVKSLRLKLGMLKEASNINDLRQPPANHLEALAGNLEGFHSIRINRQFRLVFKWQDNTAYDIFFVDYH